MGEEEKITVIVRCVDGEVRNISCDLFMGVAVDGEDGAVMIHGSASPQEILTAASELNRHVLEQTGGIEFIKRALDLEEDTDNDK